MCGPAGSTSIRGYAANGLNQYTTAGPASFAYDANGNLTGDETKTYGYDAENRLVSSSAGAALAWDPLGRLFQTSGGAAGVTRFLYDGDALVAEYSAAGAVLRRYVHGQGADEPLAAYEDEGASVAPADERFLMADHQGSIVLAFNRAGAVLALNTYDEYGTRREQRRALPVYRPGVAARTRHVPLQGAHLFAHAGAVPAGRPGGVQGPGQSLRVCGERSGRWKGSEWVGVRSTGGQHVLAIGELRVLRKLQG